MTNGQLTGTGTGYSKVQLLVILLTPLLVMAASTGLFFSGWLTPDERVNKGILIDPVLNISDLGLDAERVNPDRQWLLVQTSAECTAQCQEQVYTQRQIHIALGKYQPRVHRVLLAEGDDLTAISDEYPALTLVEQSAGAYSEALRNRIPVQFRQRNYVFLVDPLGNVPLYFTPENNYKDQLTDIKKLLKLSTIG